MAKKVRTIVYECEFTREDVPWVGCQVGKPFKSISKEAMETHEKGHKWLVSIAENNYALRDGARKIVAERILTGVWEDWEEMFEIIVTFSRVIHRQPLFVGQSLRTYEYALDLLGKLMKFIWLRTNEPRPNYHPFGEAWDAIHAFHDQDKREKILPKDTSEHQIELKSILERLNRRILAIRNQFGGELAGMKELEESIWWISESVDRDVATAAKQKAAEAAVSA